MSDRYAVITGASAGLGTEFALQLSKRGYQLVLIARRKERLEQLAEKLRAQGTEVMVLPADLSQKEECLRVMQQIKNLPIEVFVNNAGFGDCGLFAETDLDRDLQMLDVNVKAVHIFTKRMVRKLQEQDYGYLLNVASCAGLFPAGPYMATYYATKAYVCSLTRAVARELQDKGSRIYVGALCPGPVNTEFNDVANVEFALPGISAKDCVTYALRQMEKRKKVIIPTLAIKAGVIFGRWIPQELLISITTHQQKKKIRKA